jgi:hypothetical protein
VIHLTKPVGMQALDAAIAAIGRDCSPVEDSAGILGST